MRSAFIAVFFYLALFIPFAKLRLTTQKPIIKETTRTTGYGGSRATAIVVQGCARGEKRRLRLKGLFRRKTFRRNGKRLFLSERGGIETPLARLCFLSPRNEKGNASAA
jgi:hypothetical protein